MLNLFELLKTSHAFIVLFFSILFLLNSCKNPTLQPPPFDVPKEFEIIPHDPTSDEILALKYKKEMMITVSKNISKVVKESAFFGPGPMKIAFEAKFPILVEKYNGENLSKLSNYPINDKFYMHRSFDYVDADSSTKGYYEYGAMYIKEPEAYYDFFISGDKSKQTEHRAVINKLLEAIPIHQ